MAENYLVSIIVPMFNMERTIEKCLNSITQQSYKNIEIVVINDGSKDRSEKIVNYFRKKDFRIVLISQENKGLAMAYYRGIKEANGEFVLFVDSDDYIDQYMVEGLVGEQRSSGAEIVQSGVKRIHVKGCIMSCSHVEDKIYRDKKDLYIAYFLTSNVNQTFAGNLIKKSLFQEIPFEKGSLSTDLQVMPFLLEKCNYFQQISKVYYCAVFFPDSVSRGAISDRIIDDKFYCTKVWEQFFDDFAPSLREIMLYRKVNVSMDVIYKIKSTPGTVSDEEVKIKHYRKEFIENYKAIKHCFVKHYLSKKEIVKMWLFNVSPQLFFNIYSSYSKFLEYRLVANGLDKWRIKNVE